MFNTVLSLDAALFYRFAVALGIGMLVGFERELRKQEGMATFAGVRTFAIFALIGCTSALISTHIASPLPIAAAIIGISALLVAAYTRQINPDGSGAGLTTEVTALLTVLAGALCYYQYITLAAALGVAMLVLLSLKPQLHRFAEAITYADIYAALKFAVISLIVLPILPDRAFGPPPFDVLNPYNIWWMVVLISGISFAGFVLMKVVDPSRGIGLTGLLGGVVSSTAVTLSFSGRSKEEPKLASAFALAIVAAWAVMFVRVLIEVLAVNRPLLEELWKPMVAGAAVGLAYAYFLYRRQGAISTEGITFHNPFELGPAFKFGLIYAVVLLVVRTAEIFFGTTGLYVSSVLSGTVDLHAITLSMAQLSQSNSVDLATAARAITLAALSNTIVKAGIVVALGTPGLRKKLLPAVPLLIVACVAAAWFS